MSRARFPPSTSAPTAGERTAPRPVLLMPSGGSPTSCDRPAGFQKGSPRLVSVWELPHTRRIRGLHNDAQKRELRVISSFDRAP